GAKEQMTGRGVVADNQFAQVLQLEMKEGRFFSPQFLTDSLAVVLNEKAVSELGLTNPVGAKLNNLDDNFNPPGGPPHEFTVVGVVKDFHFQSMHQAISPLVIMNAAQFQNFLPLTAIRTKGNNLQKTINDVEQTWKKFVKDEPFKFTFLDQTLENQYVAEQTTKRVFSAFSVLAIFIACIGLLGLVAYATQLRSREISIRKVLGASVSNVIKMLSVDFMKLVLIASLIAFPVAWLGMNKWLEDFAYRINVQWWVLILSALGALAVALFTISIQAIKAALSNPVRNLRSE
ncbi:MAG: ABC transporter permease, partial [Bacteroidota bacterium]|nr:ABC transporter permease [Bacteroidota bacterium]